jgi:diacylglycerol kinase family enzyme
MMRVEMDDGLLDVQIYDGMGDAALVKHFMAASSGAPNDLKTYRVRRVRITTEEKVLTSSGVSVPVESAPSAPPSGRHRLTIMLDAF